MATYMPREERERNLVWCAVRDATVIVEGACARADANTVCASRSMTMSDLPPVDSNYFDVIMRVDRLGRRTRLRRAR